MKNLITLAAVAFSLYACTEEAYLSGPATGAPTNATHKKGAALNPANPLNPKDSVGAVFGLLYEDYSPGTAFAESLAAEVLDFAMHYDGFAQLAVGGVPAPQPGLVQGFLGTAPQNVEAALQATGLSPQGRTSLASLAGTLQNLKASGDGYESAHEAIVAYELGIGTDGALTAGDTGILYAMAAVLRYELEVQRRKKRKDRDWEMSVGHIAATAYGASGSDPEAILYGLITSHH